MGACRQLLILTLEIRRILVPTHLKKMGACTKATVNFNPFSTSVEKVASYRHYLWEKS